MGEGPRGLEYCGRHRGSIGVPDQPSAALWRSLPASTGSRRHQHSPRLLDGATGRTAPGHSPLISRLKLARLASDPRVCNTGVYNPHSPRFRLAKGALSRPSTTPLARFLGHREGRVTPRRKRLSVALTTKPRTTWVRGSVVASRLQPGVAHPVRHPHVSEAHCREHEHCERTEQPRGHAAIPSSIDAPAATVGRFGVNRCRAASPVVPTIMPMESHDAPARRASSTSMRSRVSARFSSSAVVPTAERVWIWAWFKAILRIPPRKVANSVH